MNLAALVYATALPASDERVASLRHWRASAHRFASPARRRNTCAPATTARASPSGSARYAEPPSFTPKKARTIALASPWVHSPTQASPHRRFPFTTAEDIPGCSCLRKRRCSTRIQTNGLIPRRDEHGSCKLPLSCRSRYPAPNLPRMRATSFASFISVRCPPRHRRLGFINNPSCDDKQLPGKRFCARALGNA